MSLWMTDDQVKDPAVWATPQDGGRDPVGHLLIRMRGGDRVAAAQFLERFGQRIRRRVHGRLRPYVRRLFDSQEIVSTVARRLDLLVRGGKLTAASEGELWALVFTIAENAAIDKTRLSDRVCTLEASAVTEREQPAVETALVRSRADSAAIKRAFSALQDGVDREILSLWLQDTPHLITARLVGLSPTAVRKRWEMIKRRLRPVLAWEQ
jgi:DNA-directed RNA polymerase specialized sigma24 family protein